MITVEISINLKPIHTVTAINVGTEDNITYEYDVFKGISRKLAKTIFKVKHVRSKGAVVLVKKMLDLFPA